MPSAGDAGADEAATTGGGPRALRAANTPIVLRAVAGATRSLRRPPSLTRQIALAIVALWALGALAGFIGLGRSLMRVRSLKARSSPLEGTLADDLPWLTETAGREIYLRLSYEIETPIAIGFRRPVILIPTDMATAAGLDAIEPLVMHEYAHLARYDDWSNLVQRAIERLVWFNPLAWYAGRRIALEREVAADEAVVARTNDARGYAATLWRMAREMRMPEHVVVAPGAMLTRKQISVRIERILEDSRARHVQAGTALAVIAVGACTVAAIAATAPPLVIPTLVMPASAQTAAALVDRPQPPPAVALDVRRQIADAGAKAADDVRRALGVVPHALPEGELTRAIVAACRSCDFSNRNLSGLDLSHLTFTGANFDNANLDNVDFTGAQLVGVSFGHTNLSGADFSGARVTGSRFEGVDLSGADVSGAHFVGSMLDAGTLHANGSMRSMIGDCAGCSFSNADLHGQDLHGMRLTGANLENADLHATNLRGALLSGANLQNADLDGADLRHADLTGANLSGASMDGTQLDDAHLTGTTLP
jgi:uncharacterized protein YjbI with pentapeptide repeats/beta-lactamase regulating signal transducer with metallopeptidase domain